MAEKFTELGRVEAVARLFEGTGYKPFETDLLTAAPGTAYAQASALFLEGIDFDLTYFPLKHLGYKSVLAATGELYARLARPRGLEIRLGISAKLEFSHIAELWSGIVSAAKEHGYDSVSLDLAPSKTGLCIALSAVGEAPVKRRKPKSMDLICVSDNLAAAYLGFSVLEREKQRFEAGSTAAGPQGGAGKANGNQERSHPGAARPSKDSQPNLEDYKLFVGAYLKPYINPDILKRFKEAGIVPSAGCFVTKGLSEAVKRLARDTALGAKIYIDRIPFEGNSFDLGKKLNIDPVTAALNGGEDYRLLFTIPISQHEKFRRDFQSFDIIGHLALPEVGAVLVTPDGVELPLRAQGWKDPDDEL